MNCVLLADDDHELCELLKQNLEIEGFEVGIALDGEAALNAAHTGDYELM